MTNLAASVDPRIVVALGTCAIWAVGHAVLAQSSRGNRVARPVPPNHWDETKSGPILEKTQTIRLEPDLSGLSAAEKSAVAKLLEVGAIMQRLYEDSRHHQAESALRALATLDTQRHAPAWSQNLIALYRLNQGPIATTLENKREPFLPVDPLVPGKNVYPWGVTKDELDAWLAKNPEQRDAVLDPRTVVRRADPVVIKKDIAALARHPVLAALHPGLRRRLETLPRGDGFYAVPYAVAWADEVVEAHGLLTEAADAIQAEDPEFARYLRNRGRDLLSNDYESGDAAWVTGRFGRLNAQIGAYETYDDELYGTKAFWSFSLLVRDTSATDALRSALGGLQELQDSLPSPVKRRVREGIPVGVYDVAADFGQARGVNTATILPNDPLFARRYGRTILMRKNVLRHPDLYANAKATWEAAVHPEHWADLHQDGNFQRTLWHEVGHYLGVDVDKSGRSLDDALQSDASAFEEMKADLVALLATPLLRERGYYADDAQARAVWASGILRVLLNTRPRRDQAYQTMMLTQMNWYLEKGVLEYEPETGVLRIHYDRYPDAVRSLLERVLRLQHEGDKAAASAFLDHYTRWEEMHEKIAARIRERATWRFRLVRYGALGE
jgi:hypothetical protein